MKRIITLLTFVLLTMSVVAQQRMHFLGQPLGCSLATFKQRMASRGYKYKGEVETNVHYFDGVFGGDDVTIGAFVTPKSKIVSTVTVVLINYKSYHSKSSIESKKNLLIQSYSKKYGDYLTSSDTYYFWEFDYGYISIQVDYSGTYPIYIFYRDKIGDEIFERELESDY